MCVCAASRVEPGVEGRGDVTNGESSDLDDELNVCVEQHRESEAAVNLGVPHAQYCQCHSGLLPNLN